jgi:hypothetical protein
MEYVCARCSQRHEGITLARVIEIAGFVLHDADPPR